MESHARRRTAAAETGVTVWPVSEVIQPGADEPWAMRLSESIVT